MQFLLHLLKTTIKRPRNASQAPVYLQNSINFDSFADNPLNCDCLMAGFARWLREAKNLSQSDKSAAYCATPPHLEGALLSRLSKNKLCDDFDHIEKTAVEYNKITAVDVEEVDVESYDDKGVDDDLYDDGSEVPKEEDLPTSKAKVRESFLNFLNVVGLSAPMNYYASP